MLGVQFDSISCKDGIPPYKKEKNSATVKYRILQNIMKTPYEPQKM
jgi:hypothetical protein